MEQKDTFNVKNRVRELLAKVKLGRKTTPGVVVNLYEKPKLQKVLMHSLNEFEETQDEQEKGRLREKIFKALNDYKDSNADGHSNPEWSILNAEAVVNVVTSDIQDGLDLHLASVKYAKTDYQKAISYSCVSDCLRLQGRTQEAIEPAIVAVEFDDQNEANWMYLLMALRADGRSEEVQTLLEAAPDIYNDDAKIFSLYRRYPELRELELPKVH